MNDNRFYEEQICGKISVVDFADLERAAQSPIDCYHALNLNDEIHGFVMLFDIFFNLYVYNKRYVKR